MTAAYGSTSFFTKVIDTPALLGLSSGYENNRFRNDRLADLMFNALPEFALSYKEFSGISGLNMIERMREAALSVYRSHKFKRRGEFGELLLHLVMRDFYKTIPAVSKIYYKDSANNTVKGFDSVHVVEFGTDLELWVGETKFYKSISRAMSSVVKDLKDHTKPEFMRDELLFIQRKLDQSWPHYSRLKQITHKNVPLNKIFNSMKIPVLLTYESKAISNFTSVTSQFTQQLEQELKQHEAAFRKMPLPDNVTVILILVPLHLKMDLLKHLNAKLKAAQLL